LVEDVSLIGGYARNEDASVRAAAAGALRKMQTSQSEKVLLALAADSDKTVRSRALHTLTRYSLTPTHLNALRRLVQSGQLVASDFPTLMTLLERHRDQSNAVLPVLETLFRQDISNKRLLLRIRTLYNELSPKR